MQGIERLKDDSVLGFTLNKWGTGVALSDTAETEGGASWGGGERTGSDMPVGQGEDVQQAAVRRL